MWLSLSYGAQVELAAHISDIICACAAAISSFLSMQGFDADLVFILHSCSLKGHMGL